MQRRTFLALALTVVAGAAGCGSDRVTGNPIGGGTQRTLAAMRPLIVKSLTTTSAEQAFGFPDERTPSPPIILTYYVEDGGKVSLGFPDLVGTIVSATFTPRVGTPESLTIYP